MFVCGAPIGGKGGKVNSRIRLKMGDIEVEYEGSEDFVKSELLSLVSQVASLYRETGLGLGPMDMPPTPKGDSVPESGVSGTTGTIASRLDSRTGPGLLTAAAAHLTFVKGLSLFTRQQLHDEMKTAKPYYKGTYSKNLSYYLQRLVKTGQFVESAKDTYALSANKNKELESILAS